MGQKCCRPAIRQHPKHTDLLNLIYTETPQNIKKIDHEGITEYLNKKGYVKTLSDYLSSHLYLINSSFLYCKSKLVSNRTKKPFTQLYFSFLTSQVVLKIALMCRQVKLIYYNKKNANKKQLKQQGEKQSKTGSGKLEGLSLDLMTNSKQFSDLRQDTRGKLKRKNVKLQIFQREFLQQDINLIILDICNEMLKQSINTKYFFSFQVKPQLALSEEATVHKTLVNVEKILSNILSERVGNFIKINYSVIKQILDNQIILLVMGNSKSKEQNTYSLALNIGRQSIRRNMDGQSQTEQNNLLSSIYKLPNLNFEPDEALNFRTVCLQNYSRLLYKAKINQADINLSKDIVKIHLPILLEMWANLMIEKKSFSNIRKMESQIKRDIMLEKNADMKTSKNSLKQKMEETQKEQDNKNKNIQHMELIIQSIIFELFNSYFSLKESEYIYKELILIFDKLNFRQSQVLSIQRLVFIALRKHELKDFVMSKWFDYLLDYLAIVTTYTSPPQINQNVFTPELNSNQPYYVETSENYLSRINIIANPQIERSQYTNWRKQQNIVGCLRTIIRWITQDQVEIESIINFKHNKLIFAVLANLAWGSPKINKKIYELIGILIDNSIRCFQYLVNICMMIINRLRIGYIVDIEHDWRYFITKWEQDKLRMNKGQSLDEKFNVQKLNTLKLRLKRKTTITYQLDAQIQLISIEKYIDELIQLTCYPFLFKIKKEINGNILQVVGSEEIKKSSKRYSSLDPLKISQTLEKEKEDEINEMPNRNTGESTFDQIQRNSLNSYTVHLYHLKSMQISETGKRKYKSNVDPQLFNIVFSETLQQMFKNIKFHHHRHDKNCRVPSIKNQMACIKRQSNYWQVKLTSLMISSNLMTMIKLIGDRKSRQTDFNHILQLTGILNKFLAKLCRELKHHSHIVQKKQQLHGRWKSSVSMNGSFEFQRQSSSDWRQINLFNQQVINNFSKEPVEQNFHKSFEKQQKNINMISHLFDIIHVWVYPALIYLLEYSSLLTNYSKERSKEADNFNLKQTKLAINIITKLYYLNLLKIATQILTKEILINYGRCKIELNESKSNDSYSQSDISISEIRSPKVIKNQNFDHLQDGQENEIFLQFRQKFMATFLSVLQLYSLFFLFYNQYTKKGSNTENILSSNKSNDPTGTNFSSKVSLSSHLKKNGSQKQFLNKIKTNEQNLKNYLQNINKEINNKVKNRIILSGTIWQETILQTESVLNDKKLSEMMIIFIDDITNLSRNELQKQDEKQLKNISQFQQQKRKILRQINKHILVESVDKEMNSNNKDKTSEFQQSNVQASQMGERNQCCSYQKTKKNILKVFNRISNNQPPHDPNLMENKTNKMNLPENENKLIRESTEIPQLLRSNRQNEQPSLLKIIDYFSQSYTSHQMNRLGTKSNDQFNFNLILEKGEDSVVNSSSLNRETLQGSFAEVLSEIKKS